MMTIIIQCLGIYLLGVIINYLIFLPKIREIEKDNSLGGLIYSGFIGPWIFIFIVFSWIGLIGFIILKVINRLNRNYKP